MGDLTVASFNSLAPASKGELFKQVIARAEQVLAVSQIDRLVPDAMDDYLPLMIERMEARLAPCDEADAAAAIDLACQILRCRKPEGQVLKAYLVMMAKMPRDMLFASVAEACAEETYHVLPTPGRLMATGRVEQKHKEKTLWQAKHAKARLDIARAWRMRRDSYPRRLSSPSL